MLLIEVVQEWFMLVNYEIKISVSKCLIRGNVVREFLYIDLKAVLFSFFGSCFNNLSVRAAVAPTVISFFSAGADWAEDAAGLASEPQPVMTVAAESAQRPVIISFFNISKTSFLF